MTEETASWFGARLLFESVHPEETVDEPLFEEQIILVRALDEAEAERKALEAGAGAEHEYKNVYGKRVVWTFRELLDLVMLYKDEIVDCGEVYSSFLTADEVHRLRKRFGKVPADSV